MSALKLVDVPEPQSIREEAFRSLIKNLGISRAAFFARECMSQKEDYVKLKDEIFGNQSLEDKMMLNARFWMLGYFNPQPKIHNPKSG